MNMPQGYSLKFVPSDDPQQYDDEYKVCYLGQPTRFGIQVSGCYHFVNEYGFKDGNLDWWKFHGEFPTKSKAVAKVVKLLA